MGPDGASDDDVVTGVCMCGHLRTCNQTNRAARASRHLNIKNECAYVFVPCRHGGHARHGAAVPGSRGALVRARYFASTLLPMPSSRPGYALSLPGHTAPQPSKQLNPARSSQSLACSSPLNGDGAGIHTMKHGAMPSPGRTPGWMPTVHTAGHLKAAARDGALRRVRLRVPRAAPLPPGAEHGPQIWPTTPPSRGVMGGAKPRPQRLQPQTRYVAQPTFPMRGKISCHPLMPTARTRLGPFSPAAAAASGLWRMQVHMRRHAGGMHHNATGWVRAKPQATRAPRNVTPGISLCYPVSLFNTSAIC